MPSHYPSKLISQREVAEGTIEFIMEKPVGTDFSYLAGQFGDIELPHAEDAPKMDYTHGFSFVSAPFEDDVRMATRMRSSSHFKNAIAKVADGSPIQLIATWGKFTLHEDASVPAVFITGGIGITPVLSILKQAAHDNKPHKMTLIYANRTPAQAAYTNELEALVASNANLKFVPVYTQKQGHVDAKLIKQHITDITASNYYVCGPEGLVNAMTELLAGMGVNKAAIRREKFEGY